MTNHVHLLLTPESTDGISRLMQTLGRHYVRYFNFTYKRSGALWEGRFKSCVVHAESYLLLCQRYIELNPVRAGMVESPGDYHWSSYRANGDGKPAACWTAHPVYLALGTAPAERALAYRRLFLGQIDEGLVGEIRKATQQGMALGSERFKAEVESLAGRRVVHLRRGPKPTRAG